MTGDTTNNNRRIVRASAQLWLGVLCGLVGSDWWRQGHSAALQARHRFKSLVTETYAATAQTFGHGFPCGLLGSSPSLGPSVAKIELFYLEAT